MDLEMLAVFQSVVRTGSISRAAHELRYAQSNISTKIHKLESDLCTILFYRHNRGVSLTAKGRMLLNYSEQIFNLIKETTEAMKDDNVPGGPLAIGSLETTASVHLPKLLAEYHHEYPNVDLALKTGTTEKNIREVLAYNLDGAFIAGPIDHPALTQKKFTDEELVLVTDHEKISPSFIQEIQNRTLLVFPTGCSYRRILEQWLQSYGLLPKKIIEFDTLEAIIGCVCAGLGISLLPLSVAERFAKKGTLKIYPIGNTYSKVQVIFIYRQNQFIPASLRRFIEMLR